MQDQDEKSTNIMKRKTLRKMREELYDVKKYIYLPVDDIYGLAFKALHIETAKENRLVPRDW